MTKEAILEQFNRTQNAENNIFDEPDVLAAMDIFAKQQSIGFVIWIPANRWQWNSIDKLWERYVSHSPNERLTTGQLYEKYLESLK